MELYNQEIKNYSPSKVENSMKPKFARTTQVTHNSDFHTRDNHSSTNTNFVILLE